MEFVDGGSILDKIKKQSKPLNEEQIAYVVHEVLLGLDYLSRSNKIHRDIKAANSKRNNKSCTQRTSWGEAGWVLRVRRFSSRWFVVRCVFFAAAVFSPAVALRTGEAGESTVLLCTRRSMCSLRMHASCPCQFREKN